MVACLGLTVDLHNETSMAELKSIERMHISYGSVGMDGGSGGVATAAEGGISGGTDVDTITTAEEKKTNHEADPPPPPRHMAAIRSYVQGKMDYLASARPTAVNVFNALQELKEKLPSCHTLEELLTTVKAYGEFVYQRDGDDCRQIGRHGAEELILQKRGKGSSGEDDTKLTVLTICNTGSLATSQYGTALGVIRALQERNRLERCIALETRPYNQGSRLTAFEMVHDQLNNATLICDSMAAAFFQTHQVDAVVVGADRICANGDTANKIGTYSLALVANAHHIPFYVAAPFTTLDTSMPNGSHMTIEERSADEILSTSRAPKNIAVWNPAFDVTPAQYVTGIITEMGIIRPNDSGFFDVAAFVQEHTVGPVGSADVDADATQSSPRSNPSSPSASPSRRSSTHSPHLKVPSYYREQTTESLPQYLAEHAPHVLADALGASDPRELTCVEFGDGNLNLVFIVANQTNGKQVIVKQALPYVRCVGESWPLTLERSMFEHKALCRQKECCPAHVPTVYYFSFPHGLIAMEYLAPPIQILRKGLIQGIQYPTVARDVATFCAKTFFGTSGFTLSATELREQVEFWSKNREMCALTESVVFTEPYMEHSNNRWNSPHLDDAKRAIESDVALKHAAAEWKRKFVTDTSALIHGDLHSGSVMCGLEPHQTYVIDPEFAFYGPMGFDTGAFVANLFLSYVSQPGHNNGDNYSEWVLQQIQTFWETFTQEFTALWDDPSQHTGFLFGREALRNQTLNDANDNIMAPCQSKFLQSLLSDTLGFCGTKMLRRVVGIAHVADLESIEDPVIRAQCELHALQVAQVFILRSDSFASMDEAIDFVRRHRVAV